jgi:hypothetical protein
LWHWPVGFRPRRCASTATSSARARLGDSSKRTLPFYHITQGIFSQSILSSSYLAARHGLHGRHRTGTGAKDYVP